MKGEGVFGESPMRVVSHHHPAPSPSSIATLIQPADPWRREGRVPSTASSLEQWEDTSRGVHRYAGLTHVLVFGRGFVPPADSPLHADPGVPEGGTALVGSVMILHAEHLDQAWSIIRDDIYWTEGVWDREKGRVEEFIQM